MSKLQELAKELTTVPSELRLHPDAKEFHVKFPVVKENIQQYFSGELSLLNKDLSNSILTYGDKQQRKTNVKAHMTDWFMHKEYKTFDIVGELALQLAIANSPHKIQFELFDIWGVIYQKGDFTKSHDHWPHPWSFVYYVESSGETPLIFPDAPQGAHYVYAKTGDIVLFPGWIRHNVPIHEDDSQRIIVAGNLNVNTGIVNLSK